MESENMGIIKKLMPKGFGFIEVKGRKKDLFFHASQMKGFTFTDLEEGDEVTFEGIEPSNKGEGAFGVKLIIK